MQRNGQYITGIKEGQNQLMRIWTEIGKMNVIQKKFSARDLFEKLKRFKW
jgi:hypothetical protein